MADFQGIEVHPLMLSAIGTVLMGVGYLLGRWDGYYRGREAAGKWWAQQMSDHLDSMNRAARKVQPKQSREGGDHG